MTIADSLLSLVCVCVALVVVRCCPSCDKNHAHAATAAVAAIAFGRCWWHFSIEKGCENASISVNLNGNRMMVRPAATPVFVQDHFYDSSQQYCNSWAAGYRITDGCRVNSAHLLRQTIAPNMLPVWSRKAKEWVKPGSLGGA